MSGICCKSGAQCAPYGIWTQRLARRVVAQASLSCRCTAIHLLAPYGEVLQTAQRPYGGGSSLLLTLSGNRAAAVPGYFLLRAQRARRAALSESEAASPAESGHLPRPRTGAARRVVTPYESLILWRGLSPAKTRSAAKMPRRSRARGRGPPDTPCGPPRSPS